MVRVPPPQLIVPPGRDLADEGGDAERDQRVGRRGVGAAGRADRVADLGALARALGAAHPDRRRGHAVRADGPAAVRAGDVGLAPRVSVAGRHGAIDYMGGPIARRLKRAPESRGCVVGWRLPPRGSRVTSTASATVERSRHRRLGRAVGTEHERAARLDDAGAPDPDLIDLVLLESAAAARGRAGSPSRRCARASPRPARRRWPRDGLAQVGRRLHRVAAAQQRSRRRPGDEQDQHRHRRCRAQHHAAQRSPPAGLLASAPGRDARLRLRGLVPDDLHQVLAQTLRRRQLLDRSRQQIDRGRVPAQARACSASHPVRWASSAAVSSSPRAPSAKAARSSSSR